MAGGRPTDYDEEVISEFQEYLKQCERLNELPTMQGLALSLNVNRDTLYEWAKHHPEFSDSLDILNNSQANKLMQKGLDGTYNPTIAKLILSSNHGMRERTDLTTNDKDIPQPLYGGLAKDSI